MSATPMRSTYFRALLPLAVLSFGCSGKDVKLRLGEEPDASIDPSDGGTIDAQPEASPISVDVGSACKGLQCQQTACEGGASTTVTGTVYAPNGSLPIYNAL